MKTSISIITGLILSLVTNTITAQTSDPAEGGKFTFGLKAGGNYANVWDEQGQEFDADARIGFAGGAFLGIPIGELLGVQPEILLSQKGFQANGILLGQEYSFTRTNTFIDVPLLIQVKPIEYITILAGPHYSYLIHRKDVYKLGTNSSAQENEFKTDNFRKNILGFTAGIDININHLVVSGRAGWDFQTNLGDGSSITPRYKNQWLQLTLGFKV